ncbi:unnamed protein product [Adineta steineri]|uniref:MULE transposase domain-containing protein n=1 Tax=Adineta steineri TaxID=433720 RepID=A0A815TX34_9BILA|nr:unnamed protein product [Adineta steineri]CAF1510673.1 unnamed protein product [Adineta steineri]
MAVDTRIIVLYLLKPSFQHRRRKTIPHHPISDTFEIPNKSSQTLDAEDVLLFATDLQLEIFFQSSHIFMDGTFNACPPYFDHKQAKELGLTFERNVITIDFEPDLIKAIKHQFPNSRHKGCNFHYNQSIYKKIQSRSLSSQYDNGEEVRSYARKLMAFPLLPLEKMNLASEYLFENHPYCLESFFNYFQSFWKESVTLELWNV